MTSVFCGFFLLLFLTLAASNACRAVPIKWVTEDVAIIQLPSARPPFSCRACRGSSAPMSFLGHGAESFGSGCVVHLASASRAVSRACRTKGEFPRLVAPQRTLALQPPPFPARLHSQGINVPLLCATILGHRLDSHWFHIGHGPVFPSCHCCIFGEEGSC